MKLNFKVTRHARSRMNKRNVSDSQVLTLLETGKVYNNAKSSGFVVWDPRTELALFVVVVGSDLVLKTTFRVWARELNYLTRGMVFDRPW